MYKLYLALKFFFSRKINWISVVGVAAGVWLLIVVPSVMNGFIHEQKTLIRGTLSDLVISPKPIRDFEGKLNSPSEPLTKYEEVLKSVPEVAGYSPRLTWFGFLGTQKYGDLLLSSSNSQILAMNAVQIVGIDIEKEKQVSLFEEYLRKEPLPGGAPVQDPNDPFRIPVEKLPESERLFAAQGKGVIFPEPLFRELEFEAGERILLQTLTFDGQVELDEAKKVSLKYYIVGSYRTGAYEMDASKVYMKRELARDFAGTPREFTEIAVKLKDFQQAEAAKETIRRKLFEAGLPSNVETWEDQRSFLLRAVNNEKFILMALLFAVILVAGVNIFVILSLMVGYKTRDIGILGALGASPSGIMGTFVGVGFFTGIFGELIGGVAGYLTVAYLTPFEYFLRDYFGIVLFDPKVYAFDHLPAIFSWSWFVMLLIVTMLVCLLASLIPALRAARFKPVEAIRYE